MSKAICNNTKDYQHNHGNSYGRWLTNEKGTFEIKDGPKKQTVIKIANYGIRIKTVLFVVTSRGTQVRYSLEYFTPDGTQSQIIRHEDLADEQAFFRVALAGFAITAIPKSFALLRECLMADLPEADREAILMTLGWYVWQGKPIFARAGGSISADSDCWEFEPGDVDGTSQLLDVIDVDKACSDVPILAGTHKPVTAIHVSVPEQFAGYRPDPPGTKEDVQKAVRAVLDLLALGDPSVTYMAVPALFAAAIQDPRIAIFLYGETGSLKTAFALLLLSFFIPDAQERDCASFKSTENALRALFSTSGNVPIIVDDYIQLLGSRNGGNEARKAENLIRSVVNRTGKDRCAGDGSLRPIDRPRGLPIITGEVLPDGLESLRRRTINLPVDRPAFEQAIQGTRPNQLDWFQTLAASGIFANAMGAFIAWAAGRLPRLRAFFGDPGHNVRPDNSVHPRLLEATEYILSGAAAFLEFAREIGVCSDAEYECHESLAVDAALSVLDRAYLESLEDSPTEAFGQLLQAALSSLRCHIEVNNIDDYKDSDYSVPLELLGYTEHEFAVTKTGSTSSDAESQDTESDEEEVVEYKTIYKPHGKRIGWLDFNCIDLIPEAALAEANSMAVKAGMSSMPPTKTFGKMLASKDWIAFHYKDRNTYKARRDGVLHKVWRIHALRLFEIALSWSSFDVGSYEQMSKAERHKLSVSHREKMLSELRQRVATFQVESLLNSVLTDSDRNDLVIPDPPEVEGCTNAAGGSRKRYTPAPLRSQPIPGYDDPDENEDGLDS